jgi:hypothetical protein
MGELLPESANLVDGFKRGASSQSQIAGSLRVYRRHVGGPARVEQTTKDEV